MKRSMVSLVLFFLIFLLIVSPPVNAGRKGKDVLYDVYSTIKIGMTVDKVRSVIERLSPRDVEEIHESLEPSGDSTSGTFGVQILHSIRRIPEGPESFHTRLTLLFVSKGYASPLLLVSARWEKNMRNSSLEYSKKKGR
ncbi:MAG: hypothetical protein HZA36_02055 [Parcubacteria group bacterium]|nr:hypothetical protein [Parcubacteria group bacterium]